MLIVLGQILCFCLKKIQAETRLKKTGTCDKIFKIKERPDYGFFLPK